MTRSGEHLRARLDEMLRESSCTLDCLARHEFDVVDVKALKPIPAKSWSLETGALSPWDDPPPISWPGGIFTPSVEAEVALCAEHHGFDHAGLATALLATGSAAADKRLTSLDFLLFTTWYESCCFLGQQCGTQE